jgi:hypothetical protein
MGKEKMSNIGKNIAKGGNPFKGFGGF